MARSRRKLPFCPACSSKGNGEDKRNDHRRWRRATRIAIRKLIDPEAQSLPILREHSDPYDWSSDGYRSFWDDLGTPLGDRLMRK